MEELSRRRFTQLAAAGAFGAALAPILAGCGGNNGSTGVSGALGAGGTGTGAGGSQVIIAMGSSSEPAAGFDPFYGWGCGEHGHEPLIQSTLITTTTNMDFMGDVSTSYHCSEDGLAWTFKLRSDVRFSNGIPLTAHDVAYTLEGIRDAKGGEADLSMIKSVEAPNDTTAIVHLHKPYSALLYTLAVVGIVPASVHQAGGSAGSGTSYGENPIGSGRYLLEQWNRGQQVIFTANPNYYGEAPKMQRVVVVFMAEDAALAAVRAGTVDVASTSAIYSGQAIAGYELLVCQSVDSRGISLPTARPGTSKESGGASYPVGNAVTSDLALRQALNEAVDRELLVANVLNGYGTVAYSVSDGMPWASGNMKVNTDVAAAKKLLANAGWVAGPGGIVAKGETRASIDLYYPANDSVRQALASEFSNQVAAIGVEVKIHGLSWDEIYAHQYSDPILWGWGSNSPAELYSLYHSSSSSNFSGYCHKTVDKHLEDALATISIEDSYQHWQAAEWDGKEGVAPKGAATWVWFANIDHLYFKRESLVVAAQKLHPHGHGWSVANNVDQWSWK